MTGGGYATPGVYIPKILPRPPEPGLPTGVPLFIGYGEADTAKGPAEVGNWGVFMREFGSPQPDRYLAYAVRGFFANGGRCCFVASLDRGRAVETELTRVFRAVDHDGLAEDADLVCAPDLTLFPTRTAELQQRILDFCDGRNRPPEIRSHRFAILDALPDVGAVGVLGQREALSGASGALYHPWLLLADGPRVSGGFVPPCGHVAGLYARTDAERGVHAAPANRELEEALDPREQLTDSDQARLNPRGVNCIRAFPGRGIRVWGARTLSGDPAWGSVPVRRLVLTVSRWVERRLDWASFEPHSERLWLAVRREVSAHLTELFRGGAFSGATVEEAFYVKCDAEINPQQVRELGELVVEVGLAPTVPGEFIVVRIVQGERGAAGLPAPGEAGAPLPQPVRRGGGISGIVITGIVADPAGPDLAGEHLVLANLGRVAVELTNWRLADLAGHTYLFPRFTLHPGAEVRLWTRTGADSATDLYWGHRAAFWNNTGDTASLYDAQDHLIDTFVYRTNGS